MSFVLTCTAVLTMRLAVAESIEGAGASDSTFGSSGEHERSEPTSGEAAGLGSAMVERSDHMVESDVPSDVPLESTRWKAVELEGTVVPNAADPQRAAHVVFDGEGRFAGSDGCNRVMGSYQVNDDAIAFAQAASTQMACLDSGETERQFRAALADARSYRIVDHALELAGIAGTLVARFEAESTGGPAAASAGVGSELGGTSWQLVRFEGGDETTLTPDDPTKYTLEFDADGSLTARIDCNRGRGTWESPAAGQLTLGPLALTRAMCPPGSLHDQIVRQLGYVRSYVLKDGRLFLALMADGGIYEFEPAGGD
jgi:heat shock protein HslJ